MLWFCALFCLLVFVLSIFHLSSLPLFFTDSGSGRVGWFMGVECLGDYNPPKLKYSLGKEKKEREKKKKDLRVYWSFGPQRENRRLYRREDRKTVVLCNMVTRTKYNASGWLKHIYVKLWRLSDFCIFKDGFIHVSKHLKTLGHTDTETFLSEVKWKTLQVTFHWMPVYQKHINWVTHFVHDAFVISQNRDLCRV